MRFKQFLEQDDYSFLCDGVHVTITQIPLANHEAVMLEHVDAQLLNFIRNRLTSLLQNSYSIAVRGKPVTTQPVPIEDIPEEPDQGVTPATDSLSPEEVEERTRLAQKKFRIVLRYPRSSHEKTLGQSQPDVLYVYAKNKNEAKRKAESVVKSKPKFKSLLKGSKRVHFGTKASEVRSWDDLLKMIRHLAGNKNPMRALSHLGEPEFKILLKKIKKDDFRATINLLDKKEQRLLKAFYFQMAQNPWLSDETKQMVDGLSNRRANRIDPRSASVYSDEEYIDPELEKRQYDPDDEWPYWSDNEPKTEEEEIKLRSSISSIPDVFKAAARYGVPAKVIKQYYEQMYQHSDQHNGKLRSFWRELRSKLYGNHGLSHKNKIFEKSDYNNPRLARKYGVHWDELAHHYLKYNTEGLMDVQFKDDPNDTSDVDEASQWLWDFYKNGLPPRPNYLKQYENVLDILLDGRKAVLEKRKEQPDEEVPF